ncbi:hypothetical protein U9M48_005422, partial [Paspalum notatum var. saurae]
MIFHDKSSYIKLTRRADMICVLHYPLLQGRWIHVLGESNIQYFARIYPAFFTDGKRAEWEYPFAVCGINISYMLVQMLEFTI